MKRLIVLAIVAALAGCTDSDGATRTLESNGYTEVKTTGYSFFSCSDKDNFSTGFKAKSPNGTKVEGSVCSGFLKGSTIRFN